MAHNRHTGWREVRVLCGSGRGVTDGLLNDLTSDHHAWGLRTVNKRVAARIAPVAICLVKQGKVSFSTLGSGNPRFEPKTASPVLVNDDWTDFAEDDYVFAFRSPIMGE